MTANSIQTLHVTVNFIHVANYNSRIEEIVQHIAPTEDIHEGDHDQPATVWACSNEHVYITENQLT